MHFLVYGHPFVKEGVNLLDLNRSDLIKWKQPITSCLDLFQPVHQPLAHVQDDRKFLRRQRLGTYQS